MAGSPEFVAGIAARLKNATVQRAIGLGVLVVVGGTFAALKFLGGQAANPQPASVAVVRHVARPAAPAGTPSGPQVAAASTVNPKAPVVRNVPPQAAPAPAAKTAAAGNNNASAVSTEAAGAPVVTAVPQNNAPAGATQAHLDDHLTYQYNALGRRDPFQSLVDGQFVGADVGGDAPPDPGGIKVVGIVWGANDQFALVEDVRGNSFVLRKGDKVQNGVVEGLKRDGVIVNITAEGQSQSVVIPLVRKGDQNAR